MFRDVLNHPDIMIYPILGTVICFSIMLAAYFWAYRPKAKEFYNRMALSVFDEKESPRHGA